ncbi:Glucose/galactose transporter like protein [Verticillium longisporum]|uniref:Glucose/galactose transporter like protein n=1 Tax=Verticillium longisporum TaxID=100787 RepID=A0A8I3AWM8_VERLO|nr:Glucose/galactose transporter like protein [Verticillium longisporum]
MAGGGIPSAAPQLAGGYLTGRALIFPLSLIISLFFLWGFSYGLLDVLNKHFQTVLGITRLESTGLQVMYFGGGYLLFSPIAAECLKRRGYKQTILMGLGLYSLGAILFWPVVATAKPENGRAAFGGFCACILVIACGLATLETAANSYAVVIGKPDLTNVQFVYLAVACAGVAVAVMFFFAKLPEISEATIEESSDGQVKGSIWKQYNMWAAFFAQLCYVGAQVTTTFFINYAHENGGFTTSKGSTMLSYALITFTVGRFVATGIATFLSSDFILVVYAVAASALTAYVSVGKGGGAVGALIAIFFFLAPMYPTIFTLGTEGLGHHTRRAAGILVMGVSGGAVFPPIQGAIADAKGTRISYVVPMIGLIFVLGYASIHWVRKGMNILAPKSAPSTTVEQVEKGEERVLDEKKQGDAWVEKI